MLEARQLALQDDESLRALGYILEAWEEGTDSGVSPELMAYAALYTALTDLVSAFGEESVANLAGRLAQRVRAGEFSLNNTRQ
jgi:transcription initiation factor TFIIIB Brf1 subunit/transcription initiation factor TFIIB